MQEINLLAIFLTGLFTGGLTCMAVQGGLLATTIAQREEERLKDETEKNGNAIPIIAFLIAKLFAYSLLGFLLGWFGSLFQLSLSVQLIMQLGVVIFMLGTAFNILNIHPIFRYFAIQPPKFLTKLVRKQSKSKDLFAPVLLGFMTVFIPCGTTQAMMALAITSGNPLLGASILFAFVIGTAPIFFLLGYLTTKLSGSLQGKFMKFAALAIIVLALFNLNNALSLTGKGLNLQSLGFNKINNSSNENVTTEATINIGPAGYSPNAISLKSGSKVTLNIVNKDSYTCASAFTIPELGIQRVVTVGATEKIQFTTPNKPTRIVFMCSMGMYRGVINVIKS
ncbi:MAG TPA: sulfite exporter TauE/SafE family protein [Candidatus Nitrosocosmicus sp.]|nr:sulfite exporter TauE/SafE family protein [Candidatus Nitrosocosmicus sp.]